MNLFEIKEEFKLLLGMYEEAQYQLDLAVNEEEKETAQEQLELAIQALEITEGDFEEKSKGYTYKISELGGSIDNLDNHIKRLQANKKKLVANQDYLKNNLTNAMVLFGKNKVNIDDVFTLSIRSSESLEITDESLISKLYMVTKLSESPDKKAIKSFIKSGGQIEGAIIKQNNNLQIK